MDGFQLFYTKTQANVEKTLKVLILIVICLLKNYRIFPNCG